jgi:dienelactone hydrolase
VFVAWLDQQASVDKNRTIGTTGYCMGGPIVVRNAAAVPDRVGAGAAHGWCPPDSAVYNEKQAERAWTRLLALFETALR